MSIGIDIGSDSARLFCEASQLRLERPLARHDSGHALTMSALDLWRAVAEMVAQVPARGAGEVGAGGAATICVGATCSMVVMRRAQENGRPVLRLADAGHEVVVWMDRRAHREAAWLNERLAPDVLAQVGGAVTAEMGVAKMKWAERHYGAPLVVFELHDWVSYVLMAGANVRGDGRAVVVDEMPGAVVTFARGSRAVDGSVKGWGEDVVRAAELGAVHVACAPRARATEPEPHPARADGLEFFGTELAPAARAGYVVVRGCIDCYAGPVAPFSGDGLQAAAATDVTVSMVAGTLTCFVAAVPGARAAVRGVWGPFSVAAVPVYSFGQAASGKLARAAVHDGDFARVEAAAARIEARAGALLVRLARHHLYYGDRFGNRSPYGDFSMDEVVVRGDNATAADPRCAEAMADADWAEVLRYYLVLEFLAFQAAQLTRPLAPAAVHISGSQAHNARFVQMVALFAVAPAAVYVETGDAKWSGARACAQLGRAPARLRVDARLAPVDVALLQKKYGFWLELAEWQSRWRRHNRAEAL